MKRLFDINARLKSFVYAGKGIYTLISHEPNAWIHCAAIILVTTVGFTVGITAGEWIAVVLCFGLVLAAEAMNTAIEELVNLVSPEHHPLAGKVKDLAAAAVLICATTAVVIAAIVFIPYLIKN